MASAVDIKLHKHLQSGYGTLMGLIKSLDKWAAIDKDVWDRIRYSNVRVIFL